MFRKVKTLVLSMAFIMMLSSTAFCCTTIIVGKNASSDGSTFFGRCGDAGEFACSSFRTVPASNESGDYVYVDEGNGFKITLPKKAYQYFFTPELCIKSKGEWGENAGNEMGVYMSATETLKANEVALKYDPYVKNGVAESNVVRLIIPYVTSAREAVKRLGDMIDKYGSAESNGIVFADNNEIWYMEIYTGHKWIAIKCPDDKYAVIANDAILSYADISDTENVIACDDIYSFPKEKGFLKMNNGKENLAMTYNTDLRAYSQIRLWASRRFFSDNKKDDFDVNKRYEIFEKPTHKIKLDEIFEFMRYRFEDTKYTADIKENNTRPIGIERTAETGIFQIRNNKPAVLWASLANCEFSVFTPIYMNLDIIPEEYRKATFDYDRTCAYWKFRSVSTLATTNRERYSKLVRDTYKKLETKWINNLANMDKAYEKLYRMPEVASEIFARIAKEALDTADSLFDTLIRDMSVDIINDSNKYGKNIK